MSRSGEVVPGVERIAALRANAIGDLVVVTPALHALRETYPDAEMILVGKEWHRDFLQAGRSVVDRVLVSPPYLGVTFTEGDGDAEDEEEQERFFEELRTERIDVFVQLHGGGRHSNAFVRRAEPGLSAGSRAADAPALDRWIPYVYYHNEVLRFLEVASLVGATTPNVAPRLSVLDSDREEAAPLLEPLEGRKFAAIHLGASDERRRWPVERFADLGRWLRREGLDLVLVGDAGDRCLGDRFRSLVPGGALDLIGRTSLGGLVGVLAAAHLVVANDSGPRHLAEAISTPTLAVYWCGNLINALPTTRSIHRALGAWVIQCPVCGRDCTDAVVYERCGHDVSFVGSVGTDQMVSEAASLLAYLDQRPPRQT